MAGVVEAETSPQGRKRALIISGVSAAVVVSAAATWLVMAVLDNGVKLVEARENYMERTATYTTSLTKLEKALDAAELLQERAVQLPEAFESAEASQMHEEWQRAIDRAQMIQPMADFDPDEVTDLEELRVAAVQVTREQKRIENLVDKLEDHGEQISRVLDEFEAERRAQELADAQAALKEALAEADTALTDSNGRVDDDSIRSTLSALMAEAREALAQDGVSEPSELEDLAKRLRVQAQAVRDAIRRPVFADIDGEWCWPGSGYCFTVELPRFDRTQVNAVTKSGHWEASGDGYTYIVPDTFAAGCFNATVGDYEGSAALVYCPAGAVLPSGYVVEFEDARFDRLYVTQEMYVSPAFRKEDLDKVGK